MAYILANAFSGGMLANIPAGELRFEWITEEEAIAELTELYERGLLESIVGHEPTAVVLSERLGFPVELHRVRYLAYPGDIIYVAQVLERLPVTAGELTEEQIRTVPIGWLVVEVL